jgi:O-antigen/teichoic acid export membrane protein
VSLVRGIGRNTLFMALGRFTVLGVWFLVTPRMLGALGVERFGFWSLLLAMTGSIATLDLGLGVAVTRFTAELDAVARRDQVPRLVVRSFLAQAALVVLLVVPAFVFRDAILGLFHVPASWWSEARLAFTLALLGLAGGMASNLLTGALQGLQRMDLIACVTVPAAGLLLFGVLQAPRFAMPLVALLVAQLVYTAALALGLALVLALACRAGAPGRPDAVGNAAPRSNFLRVLTLGAWLQLTSIIALGQVQLDKFLLGLGVALGPVGTYEIGMRAAFLASLLPMFFLSALMPAATVIEARGESQARVELYRRGLEPYLLLVLLLTGGVVALAPALLEAWLRTPPESAVFMLRAIALAQCASLCTGIATTAVRAANQAQRESLYLGVALALHLTLSLIGMRLFGWQGILYGFVLAAAVSAAWFVAGVERWLGLKPLVTTLRAALPAVIASACAAATGTLASRLVAGMVAGRTRGLAGFAVGAIAFGVTAGAVLAVGFPSTWRRLQERARVVVQS